VGKENQLFAKGGNKGIKISSDKMYPVPSTSGCPKKREWAVFQKSPPTKTKVTSNPFTGHKENMKGQSSWGRKRSKMKPGNI